MPSYTYQFIETDETIEVYQSMKEDTLTEIEHPETGKKMPVKKVFSAPAISGFTPTPATVAPNYRRNRSEAWNSAQIE
jgi:predicted nucleic acid-binding Zn ribbon protein